jgi:signal peptidase I
MNPQGHETGRVACGLAEEAVRTFGRIRLRVFGTSMVPSILPGDLISVQRASISEISSGDVVLNARDGRMFAHRVVGCTANYERPFAAQSEIFLITRGDLLPHNDPPVSSSELLGKVISIQRGNRQVKVNAAHSVFSRALIRSLRTSSRATYLYVKLASLWGMLADGIFSGQRRNRGADAIAECEEPAMAKGAIHLFVEPTHEKFDAQLGPLEAEGTLKCQA